MTIDIITENLNRKEDIAFIEGIAFLDEVGQFMYCPLSDFHIGLGPRNGNLIATKVNIDAKLPFNYLEVRVLLTCKQLKQSVVVKSNPGRGLVRFFASVVDCVSQLLLYPCKVCIQFAGLMETSIIITHFLL